MYLKKSVIEGGERFLAMQLLYVRILRVLVDRICLV